MANIKSVTLNDGHKMPVLAYGTGTAWYKSPETGIDRTLVDAIKTAIKLGYRHIDGAEVYGTEPELGLALKESGVPRSEFFITTKNMSSMDDVLGGFEVSLKKLQVDYVDLYLIHSPYFDNSPKAWQSAWSTMEAIHSSGRAKSIGVSNFLPHHLCAILKTAKIIPAVNQIEYHPYLQQSEILALAKEHGITVEAYSPLTPLTKGAGGPVDEVVKAIAEQYKVSESVILLKWLTSQGIVAITTSGKEERLADYIEGFKKEFLLTADEVSEISKEGRKKTFRNYFGDEVEKSYKEAETAAHNNLEK